ncbi:MAG: DegT/DnrJ/EryC1/StrS family aminotransferase [Cytophagales bacterium]|nr:DegT/DnrJ/EryC1/StrS family aminotransferase [Cytophagales bacterium]
MSNSRIYLSPPEFGVQEIEHITHAIQSGWISTVGEQITVFEQKLEALIKTKRALALNSGTSALHLALKLSDMKPGDRVGVSTLTFCASANVVLYEQGVPVFIDSEMEGWNLDPALLEDYLSKHRLHALVLTHLYGMPAQIIEIRRICREHGVVLIEDAAESLGATVAGEYTGAIGDFGIFSFNGNKIITTSAGGALLGNKASYEKGLKWATQSKHQDSLAYHHEEIGYNYRMSNLLAASGVAQLAKLDEYLIRKEKIHQFYKRHLPTSCFEFQQSWSPEVKSNFWLNGVQINASLRKEISPMNIIAQLEKSNIESRPFWKPMHLQPLYKQAERIGGEVSEVLFNSGFCLPSGVGLTDSDLDRIVTVIQELLVSRGLLE